MKMMKVDRATAEALQARQRGVIRLLRACYAPQRSKSHSESPCCRSKSNFEASTLTDAFRRRR